MKKLIILLAMLFLLVACQKQKPIKEATKEPSTPSPRPTEAATPIVTASLESEYGRNVALDKPYEVSSETDYRYVEWGWSSEFINDGIIESYPGGPIGWTTKTGVIMDLEDFELEWVEFDLEEVFKISTVILYPRQDDGSHFPQDYHIEVSVDGEERETVASIEGDMRAQEASLEPVVLSFDPIDARYVKVVITKPYTGAATSDGYLVQFAEIEVYSKG